MSLKLPQLNTTCKTLVLIEAALVTLSEGRRSSASFPQFQLTAESRVRHVVLIEAALVTLEKRQKSSAL